MGGGISTLGAFRTFTNIPGPGIRKVYTLPLLGLGRVCSRRTQKAFGTAMRLCVSLFRRRRGPAGLRALATAALYLVLKSNGLRHPKNLPVKFGFSSKTVPANIAKKLPSQRCSKPLFIASFNFSHKRPTFAFAGESEYTLGSLRKIAHKGTHGETGGISGGGGITTLGAFHTVRKPCVAGCKNGKLCRFWALVGCAPEGRRKPAEQRCAYARRCSEAPRPRRAA